MALIMPVVPSWTVDESFEIDHGLISLNLVGHIFRHATSSSNFQLTQWNDKLTLVLPTSDSLIATPGLKTIMRKRKVHTKTQCAD